MDQAIAAAPKPTCILVLQGGGAMGAYHVGAFQALTEHRFEPDWVCGISIGAINGAIIAGNAPGERLAQLDRFWKRKRSHVSHWPKKALAASHAITRLKMTIAEWMRCGVSSLARSASAPRPSAMSGISLRGIRPRLLGPRSIRNPTLT